MANSSNSSSSSSSSYYSRSIIPKGIELRKKCGQLKVEEIYYHNEPYYSLGFTLIKQSNLNLNNQIIYVPSIQSLQNYITIFLEVATLLNNQNFFILQSILRFAIQFSKAKFKRHLRELLLNSPNIKSILFFDENYILTSKLRRVSLNERIDTYIKRVIQCSISYLSKVSNAHIVLIANSNDLCSNLCNSESNQQETITMNQFLQRIGLINHPKIMNVLGTSDNQSSSSESNIFENQLLQRQPIFSPHLSRKEIVDGLNNGQLHLGTLEISNFSNTYGEIILKNTILLPGSNGNDNNLKYDSLFINGIKSLNRSFHGDYVVVQLLPTLMWKTVPIDKYLNPPIDLEKEEIEASIESGNNEEENNSNNNNDIEKLGFDEIKSENINNDSNSSLSIIPMVKVVGIIKRDINEIVVTVPKINYSKVNETNQPSHTNSREEFVLCIPLDRKYPKIRIRTKQWSILQNQRIIVGIDDWPIYSQYPNGHFIKTLGSKGDWKTEIDALLTKYSVLPRPFSIAALSCLPKVKFNDNNDNANNNDNNSGNNNELEFKRNTWKDSGWIIPSIDGREDFRLDRVFSVDPPSCQDIDDAMSIKWIKDGLVEISIHIADVCAFVEKNSPLDLEAQVRSTTIYLSHQRIEMLPSLLSSDIASLHGNKERYAVTLTFSIPVKHKDGTVVKQIEQLNALELDKNNDIIFEIPDLPCRAGRTIICSVASMTYEQADKIINEIPPNLPNEIPVPDGQAGKPIPNSLWLPLRGDLRMLTVFSRQLQQIRRNNGAIDLSQDEGGQLNFKLDKNGNPIQVLHTTHEEIHDTIAELMIYANSAATRIIYNTFPLSSLIRSHTLPSIDKLKEIQEIIQNFGLNDIFIGKNDLEILNQVKTFKEKLKSNKNSNPAVIHLITSLVTRAMSEARYLCSNTDSSTLLGSNGRLIRHYGLGVEYYTHFTSPIRRYADVIVHRQLLAALELNKTNKDLDNDNNNNNNNNNNHGNINVNDDDDNSNISLKVKSNNIFIPNSKTIEIIDDTKWKMNSQLIEDSHQINTITTGDGRKIYEKINSINISNNNNANNDNLNSKLNENLFIQSKQDVVIEEKNIKVNDEIDTDEDFLDSLLDGVGENLLESTQNLQGQQHNQQQLVQNLSNNKTVEQINLSEKITNSSVDNLTSFDDELDDLLGDINENTLSSVIETRIQPNNDKNNNNDNTNTNTLLNSSQSTIKNEENQLNKQKEMNNSIATIKKKSSSIITINPYGANELIQISNHLNKMNRRAKVVQLECQQLFLRHYYLTHEEKHIALIYNLKENGFLAYVPAIDLKAPVYLTSNDNSNICCHPQLLKLKPNSGQSVPNLELQYAGRSNVRFFPTHKCELVQILTNSNNTNLESELIVCPKDMSINELNKNKTNNGKGYFKLQLMQRVIVSVYSIIKSPKDQIKVSDGLPELCLQLWEIDENQVNKFTNLNKHIEQIDEKQILDETKSKEVETKINIKNQSLKKNEIIDNNASLYGILQNYLQNLKYQDNNNNKNGKCNNVIKKNISNKIKKKAEKLVKSNKSRNITINGTGRVAFGEVEDIEKFSFIFQSKLNQLNSEQNDNESELNYLTRGKQYAMQQMKLWGEEWAEEEDLPSYELSQESEEKNSNISKQYKKEIQIANQRINKLKIAKKNSKY